MLPTWSAVASIERRPRGGHARGAPLLLEQRGGGRRARSSRTTRRARRWGRPPGGRGRSPRRPPSRARRPGARQHPAVALAHVGQRRERLARRHGLERVGERDREHPAGGEVLAHGRERPRAPGAPPISWNTCIGAIASANRRPSASARTSAATASTARSRARARERRDQLRVAVDRRTRAGPGPRGRAPPGRCRSRGRAPAAAAVRARARAAGRRRRRRTRRRARPRRVRLFRPPPREPAPGEQVAQLEQRGVGGEGVEGAPSPSPPRPPRRARRRGRARWRSRGFDPRVLEPHRHLLGAGARSTSRAGRPHSSSKSASQIHETSRPSAILSFSAIQRSSAPSSSVSVRSTSFAPAGFFTSRIDTGRPPTGIVSTRPKAPPKPSSASLTTAGATPSSSARAAAARAL